MITYDVQASVLLTKALLSQVHVDDEEHESPGSFLLPSNECVHPAFKIRIIFSVSLVRRRFNTDHLDKAPSTLSIVNMHFHLLLISVSPC